MGDIESSNSPQSDQRSDSLDDLAAQVRVCMRCRLSETRRHAVPGEGPPRVRIMFVGEAPGEVNDECGRPFVGHGGRVFDRILALAEVKRNEVFITNAVKCWPPGNRKPTRGEIATCGAYLRSEIALLAPRLVFALGASAYTAITGQSIRMRADHGRIVSVGGSLVCPVFHPNGIRYIRGGRDTIVRDVKLAIDALTLAEGEMSAGAPTHV